MAKNNTACKSKQANKKSPAEIDKLKREARLLIVRDGMMQKDVALKLGMSKQSINAWVKSYGWKHDIQLLVNHIENPTVLNTFMVYLNAKDPTCYNKVLEHLKEYFLSPLTQ